jgi:beta-lactamase superfamily II metal-dependent hydrolase
MSHEGCEIDFLAVGENSKSGDAIAYRFGNLTGKRSEQFVMVIDGGTKQAGEDLVHHIEKYYHTDTIDAVLLTHPDGDHASGLTVVLEKLRVNYLLMHLPWKHSIGLNALFRDGRVTPNSLKERLERALNHAYTLEQIARKKNITVIEPFSDNYMLSEYLRVLGPSQSFYSEMVANFRETPAPAQGLSLPNLFRGAVDSAKEAIKTVLETWNIETLNDPPENATSPENNTSVILLLECFGKKYLFTGDAGTLALSEAYNKAVSIGIDLQEVGFIQVPHHGSRRNVGPTVLNSIVGPILSSEISSKSAFISAAKEGSPKHPAKKVVNALKRRGCKVCATQGVCIRHQHNAPPRDGWTALEGLPFYHLVEE